MTQSPDNVADAQRPRVFISYAHGDERWNATVLDFATSLRKVGGVDADLDVWHAIEGQDWGLFGTSAIEESDFVLIAVSRTYRQAWQRKNEPDRNAGAVREAAAIRGVFTRDQHDFQKRVRVVLLPGAGTDDIPLDLLDMVERFGVASFDVAGLEQLVRAILGRPAHEKPDLGPLPALPSYVVGDPAADDHAIAETLAARLTTLDIETADPSAEPQLQARRAAVLASLQAVERSMSTGSARQRAVADYLGAQLYFSAGAYQAAAEGFGLVRAQLDARPGDPEDRRFEACMSELTNLMRTLNDRMRKYRFAATPRYRYPEPPVMELDAHTVGCVRTFYEVTRCALGQTPETEALLKIRKAVLLGRDERHAPGVYERFTTQQAIATEPLGLRPPTRDAADAGAQSLFCADLHEDNDDIGASALKALAKAHLELHGVERRRSGPVGAVLKRGRKEDLEDLAHLRRSIVLNTFALAISESLPWLFAASAAERREIQKDPAGARRDLSPPMAMRLARQVTMLAYYRRSHGFRLLGDHERAYNDLRILQRLGRLTRQGRQAGGELGEWVDMLDALAEYRIGELYRADHDYLQALVQLCRSHDLVQELEKRGSPISKEVAHLEIKLSIGKAKAYFEIGAMKRALKWYLTAWWWLLSFDGPPTKLVEAMSKLEAYLDRVKHDPVLFKSDLQEGLDSVVESMCAVEPREAHHARAADILVRISHLLTVLRLEEDGGDTPEGAGTSALRCLMRASELDPNNLLVQSAKLRYAMRRPAAIADLEMPDPMDCWPSGASSVDQVIRAAEHLMLERLHAAAGLEEQGPRAVARALMGHFITHTDSINLRRAILHKYLMRPRAEHREPWWATTGADDVDLAELGVLGEEARYLEFVCLRRYGSFTPFMPRPAAVSAVGGGYLLRIVEPSPGRPGGHPRMFNIVVDPGEGVINNLYAVGLSIADLDMVIATHDRPEHLAALDAILSLRREHSDRERMQPRVGGDFDRDADERLLILGNRSVVNRYSFLNGDGSHLVQHIADASVLAGGRFPSGLSTSGFPLGLTIEQLPNKHVDLGGHPAAGFVLRLASEHPDGGKAPLSITFLSDTAADGLHEDADREKPLDGRWARALAADIVVAHVNDIPTGELRDLAHLPPPDDAVPLATFDAGVRRMAAELPADASRLMYALSLAPPDPEADPLPVSLLSRGARDGGEQLYLEGLLDVCRHMEKVAAPPDREARVLVVGELNEQLGSFRGTIAREINARMPGFKPGPRGEDARPLIALTADIGLRIRLAPAKTRTGQLVGRSTVLCSTCSYNNDRLDVERFHPPQDIHDVCVKGDHEAMYWNCYVHDPGRRSRPKFMEQMGAYNPFAAGGRYHG